MFYFLGTGGHNLKPGQMIVDFVDFGNSDAVWMNQVLYYLFLKLKKCLDKKPVHLISLLCTLQLDFTDKDRAIIELVIFWLLLNL